VDVFLTAIVGFTQLVLGGMGVYVSLRPPKKEHHWYWIGAFMGVGLLGVALTGWVAQRSSNAQDRANEKIGQAATAATNANTAATNANNSALAAQNDVKNARDEARTAKDELSRLINKKSKETTTAILKLSTETESSFKAIGTLAPPPRRIPPEHRTEIIRYLATKPSKARIEAIASDVEAYRFAQDWYEVLKAAGWSIEEDRIMTFISSGQPLQGVNLKFHGVPFAPNEMGQAPTAEPIGYVVNAMNALKVTFTGQRLPDIAEGLVVLDFHARP